MEPRKLTTLQRVPTNLGRDNRSGNLFRLVSVQTRVRVRHITHTQTERQREREREREREIILARWGREEREEMNV